jgi:hypothetical protein
MPPTGSGANSSRTALRVLASRDVLEVSEQFDPAGSATQGNGADKRRLGAALKAWYGNAHQIAAFLSHANPTAWPLHATTMMMDGHLKLTTKEAVDELNGHWAASVADYDKVEAEILMMSHTLSDGIINQFPDRFAV